MGKRTLVVVSAVAALTVAACGSSSGSKGAAAPTDATSPAAAPGTSSPSGSASSGSGGSSSGGSHPVQVDITISGYNQARIKGTKGRCELSPTIGNNYDFEGADYPDLGPNGVFDLSTDTRIGTQVEEPTIKIIVGKDGYITGSQTSGIKLSPDRTEVSLNQSIVSNTNGGPNRTIKVVGSIRCG